MSVVIIGAHGQLGQELMKLYPEAEALDFDELNISDPEAVKNYDWNSVNLILNAAAYTNVDAAETEDGWRTAWQANTLGVANLAGIAFDNNIYFVTVSTDYVFDGTKDGEYTEEDPTNPQSAYGRSKVAGELALRGNKQLNVRTSWVIGRGNNFIRTMHKLSKEHPKLRVVDDQRGRPTFAKDLAEGIKALADAGAHGHYNLSNSGDVVSWFELTKTLLEMTGSTTKVEPTTTAEFSANRNPWAERPQNSAFDLTKISKIYKPRDWKKALEEYINEELNNE